VRAEVTSEDLTTSTMTAALQLEEVPTVLMTIQLEIQMALAASRCSSPTARVESIIEVARIHHLEVHTVLAAL
jgi:hypothetical protein